MSTRSSHLRRAVHEPSPTSEVSPMSQVSPIGAIAEVVSAQVVRRLGRRRVEVVLDRSAEVSARLRLVRLDDELAARCSGQLRPGRSTLRLTVPKRVPAGHARLRIDVTGPDGVLSVALVRVWVPAR